MARAGVRVAMVVFDCDSTLTAIEGIDELAAADRAAIREMTEDAMNGAVPLEAVYGRRMQLIRPHRTQLAALAQKYVGALVEDAHATVRALQSAGIDVRIMSGGLRPAVQAVADALGVPADRVAAVDVYFDDDGAYAGFDEASPLTRAFGKHEVLQRWRSEAAGPVMMVGDGITDLEAASAADVFVAYAGVVQRAEVMSRAHVVLRDRSLSAVLALALPDGMDEADSLRDPDDLDAAQAVTLWEKGAALLAAARPTD